MSWFNPTPRPPEPEHEYWRENTFTYDIKMRWSQRFRLSRRLAVRFDLGNFQSSASAAVNRNEARYKRTEIWTDRKPEELQRDGYKRVTGLHDSILWWGVPIYMRIDGGEKFDITQTDANGNLLYSQDTAATLHDVMQSHATEAFIKGMGKTQLSTMDTQKIIMIAIIAAGAFFGMYMLGIFR